ncbi:MAG: cytochrome c3 family protein [Candidatus Bathyarchaeia archaeon]
MADKLRPPKAISLLFLIVVGAALSSTLPSWGSISQPSQTGDSLSSGGAIVCGRCHPAQMAEWNMSAHAHAFDDPVFQEAWRSQGEPDVCLECHTSRALALGEDAFLGVSCEMCHGPGVTMSGNVTEEDCSRCHSYSHYPTYQEWLQSEHGHRGVGCLDCHEMPSLELRAESPTALCSRCHPDVYGEWESGSHGVAGISCIGCHLKRLSTEVKGEEYEVTGHTFFPGVPDPDCEGCHESMARGHMAWGVGIEGCLTCHDRIYMTKLHLANGSSIEIVESSVLCGQCHKKTYFEWRTGMHGSAHEAKNCTDCHSPWDPYVCWNDTLPGVPMNVPPKALQVLISSVTKPSASFVALVAALSVLLGSVLVVRGRSNG